MNKWFTCFKISKYVERHSKKKNHLFSQTEKINSNFQHGYQKCSTHAPLLSPTCAHGNSKNERKQETEEECKQSRVKC